MDKQEAVKQFMRAAGQDVPMYLTEPNVPTRRLRVKLIAEELAEFAAASGISITITMNQDYVGGDFDRIRSDDIKKPRGVFEAQTDAADALGDLLYVAYGAAVAWGIEIDPVLEEIHRSNMTKFIDGHKREDNKWVKGPSYTPANVRAVLEGQNARR